MSDHLTIEQRHKNMAAVKSKDTKPEMVVRKYLWSRGFRYRVNNPRLPGHPDIVLRKYHTCIFVNGCFWHGHEGCKLQGAEDEYGVLGEENLTQQGERPGGTETAGKDGVALHHRLGV